MMNDYLSKLNIILPKIYGRQPTACVNTYGCQQNVSDSEKIKGLLEKAGYAITDDDENADFVLFNTCAVRGHAEDRVSAIYPIYDIPIGELASEKR
ncbi:MAG: hypothetical protein IJ948_02380 [Clostridia bacterium]|nr:hypothetical protein [Clostridia bacterium]